MKSGLNRAYKVLSGEVMPFMYSASVPARISSAGASFCASSRTALKYDAQSFGAIWQSMQNGQAMCEEKPKIESFCAFAAATISSSVLCPSQKTECV